MEGECRRKVVVSENWKRNNMALLLFPTFIIFVYALLLHETQVVFFSQWMLFMSTFKCKASRENEKAFYFLFVLFFSFALHVSNSILLLFIHAYILPFSSRLLSRCLTYICNRILVHFAHLYCNINSFNFSFPQFRLLQDKI